MQRSHYETHYETHYGRISDFLGKHTVSPSDSLSRLGNLISLVSPISNQIYNYSAETTRETTAETSGITRVTTANTTTNRLLLDIKSALTVSLISVPFSIAYSSLAQVSPINGLISAAVPPIVYALMGSSFHICIGPESVVSIMVGLGVRDELAFLELPLSSGPPIASAICLVCGLLSLGLALFQTGFLADVLSGYLLLGFVVGVSNLIMIRQIPALLGLALTSQIRELASQSAITQLVGYCSNVPSASLPTIYLSLSGFAALLFTRYMNRRLEKKYPNILIIPEVLVLFVLSIGLSYALNLSSHGIATLGSFEQSFPAIPAFRPLTFQFIVRNFSMCATITLFGFIETIALIREYGMKSHYFPSGDRVLFSMGATNIITSIFGGYTTFASPSRTRTQHKSGATSLLVPLISGLLVLLTATTFAPIVSSLPQPILAVIVFDAGVRRIPIPELTFILQKRNPQELLKLAACYIGTVALTPTLGIIFCLVLSALVIIRRSTGIHVCVMGEVEVWANGQGIVRYVDISQHPEAFVTPQVSVLSIRGSLEYFNAARMSRRVEMLTEAVATLSRVETGPRDVHGAIRNSSMWVKTAEMEHAMTSGVVVLDFSRVVQMDSSAAWHVQKVYEKTGQRILVCGVAAEMGGLFGFVRPGDVFVSMVEAIEYAKVLVYGGDLAQADLDVDADVDADGIAIYVESKRIDLDSNNNKIDIESEERIQKQNFDLTHHNSMSSRDRSMARNYKSQLTVEEEENEYSTRSVRSLRSLHIASSSVVSGSVSVHESHEMSVRSVGRREVKPVHVRTLFQHPNPHPNAAKHQISNVQEDEIDLTFDKV